VTGSANRQAQRNNRSSQRNLIGVDNRAGATGYGLLFFRNSMANRIKRVVVASMVLLVMNVAAAAQQRPLVTEDVNIVKPGVIRIETGFEFLQRQTFPLSGLRGDMTKLADTRLSFGLSPNVEFQIEWTFQNFLSITRRSPSAIPLKLGANEGDTNDVGDARLWMKMKLRNETKAVPRSSDRKSVV